jgi:hypothetical protein
VPGCVKRARLALSFSEQDDAPLFPVVLLVIGLVYCAGVSAEDAKPCEDGPPRSAAPSSPSITYWRWVTLEDASRGTCKVTVVSLEKVPPECKAGSKLSASGKIIDVDIFDQRILDEVEKPKCQ